MSEKPLTHNELYEGTIDLKSVPIKDKSGSQLSPRNGNETIDHSSQGSVSSRGKHKLDFSLGSVQAKIDAGQTIDLNAKHAEDLDRDLEPGNIIKLGDHCYVLTKKLGQGGQGVTWSAIQPIGDRSRLVAIKCGNESKKGSGDVKKSSIAYEAQALASVRHPHVVPMHSLENMEKEREKKDDYGEVVQNEQGKPILEKYTEHWFVSEFIEGDNLEERMKKKPLTPVEGAKLVADIASALQEVHDSGWCHRDVKPANILVKGKNDWSYLADFGVAMPLDNPFEGSALCAGSRGYMSPEQAIHGLPQHWDGKAPPVDQRSDIFSLGMVLHFILSGGNHPLPIAPGEDTLTSLKRLVEADIKPPVSTEPLPEELVRICMKAIEKDPAKRYQSAAEMASDLEAYIEQHKEEKRAAARALLDGGHAKLAERQAALAQEAKHNKRKLIGGTALVSSLTIAGAIVGGNIMGRKNPEKGPFPPPLPPSATATENPLPKPAESVSLKVTYDDFQTLCEWPVADGKKINVMDMLNPIYRRDPDKVARGSTINIFDDAGEPIQKPNSLRYYMELFRGIVSGRGSENDLNRALGLPVIDKKDLDNPASKKTPAKKLPAHLLALKKVAEKAIKYADDPDQPFGLSRDEFNEYLASVGVKPTAEVKDKIKKGVERYGETIGDFYLSAQFYLNKIKQNQETPPPAGFTNTPAPEIAKSR